MADRFRAPLIAALLVSLLAPSLVFAAPGPPTADEQTLRTPQDTALPITLTGHDASPLGIMTFIATDPANGTVTPSLGAMTCNSSGQNCTAAVSYAPDPGYQGADSFTFTVTDSYVPPETSVPATVAITVNALPVAVDDPGTSCFNSGPLFGSFPIAEDWPEPFLFNLDCLVVANDTDADGDSLTYEIVGLPTHGDLTEVSNTVVAYQPDPDYSTLAGSEPGGTYLSDSFTYTAFDGFEHSAAAATMRLWVAPFNDPPTFTPGSNVQVNEDSGAYSAGWASAVSAGPANESAQTVTFEIVDLDVTGVPNLFAVDPAISSAGVLTFTPGANEVGLATVTVRAVDNGGLEDYGVTHPGLPVPDDTSEEAVFTIVVQPVADAPVAQDTSASTDEETPVEIDLVATDAEGDSVVFEVTDPPHGSIVSGSLGCDAGTCTQRVTYTPDLDYIGTDTFTFTAVSATPPTTSNTATVTVTIDNTNDAPSFTKGSNQTVFEDSGLRTAIGWATDISPGQNEAGQAVDFEVTNNTNTGLFSTQPAVADNGTLTFTPAANANGSATITLRLNDVDGGSSATQTFGITVTAVNDAPTFVKGADQTVLEDSGAESVSDWATSPSAGPADEAAQGLTYSIVGNTVPGLFSAAPAVAANGTLTYTPAANAFGSSTITVRLTDDGGTANGGVSFSQQTFTIAVTAINDQPSFTKGANQVDLEDAGAQAVAGWATAISAGPSESSQVVSFEVTDNSNPALFAAGPAVAANGTLTYTPAANANGSATIDLVMHDNGGIANGGDDTSTTATFSITVTAVNDAPAFTKGPNQAVPEDSGAHAVPGWATNISAGPSDEAGQDLAFTIQGNTLPSIFSVAPAVDPVSGNLTYTVAAGTIGASTITLRLSDDGGTANGGVAHVDQTFTIAVGEVNDAPTFTKGANQVAAEDSGLRTVAAWATAISPGPGESAQSVAFQVTGNTNTALFAAGPAVASNGTLTFRPAANRNGVATISLVLKDNGGTNVGGVDTSATATFTITITPVNDAPNAANDVGISVSQNATAAAIPVLANDTALPDTGETLKITATTAPGHGTVAITGGGTGLTYTPASTYRGSDLFTYTLSDGALTDTATVLLEVVQGGTVVRLSGADRYATSAAISKASYAANVPVAFIASGLGFADALSGAPVAGKLGGPILLVPGTSIPTVIRTELTRLKPARIVILGGPSAVSSGVGVALDAYTTGTVTRLAGPDRYATSAAISRASYAANVGVVYIASGLGFADALSGAPVAGKLGGPILLVPGSSIPTVVRTELTRLKPARIVILGGTSVVSSGVATALDAYTIGTVTRLAGADRYATSAAISKANYSPNVAVVFIATGTGFADALSGAPVAGKLGGPILLVPGTSIPAVIATELARLKPAKIVILGGSGAVSTSVGTSLGFYTTAS